MIRNSVKFVPWKDYKPVTADLKQIYKSVTEEEALLALDQFSERWDGKYPQISRSWRTQWNKLNTLFDTFAKRAHLNLGRKIRLFFSEPCILN